MKKVKSKVDPNSISQQISGTLEGKKYADGGVHISVSITETPVTFSRTKELELSAADIKAIQKFCDFLEIY